MDFLKTTEAHYVMVALAMAATAAFLVRAIWAVFSPRVRWVFRRHALLHALWAGVAVMFIMKAVGPIRARFAPVRVAAPSEVTWHPALSGEESMKFDKLTGNLLYDDRGALMRMMDNLPEAENLQFMRKMVSLPAVAEDRRRYQAARTYEELRLLDHATDQYAIDHKIPAGVSLSLGDLKDYIKPGIPLYDSGEDVLGHAYGPFTVDSEIRVPGETFNALSDVADPSFWSPFK